MPTWVDTSPKKKGKKKKVRDKMSKVMAEFMAGTLRSSSGQLVKDRKQAIAIGMAMERRHKKYYDD